MRGGWRCCLNVLLLVGVRIGGYGFTLVGGDGETWGTVGTGTAAEAVGGGGIGACTLCSHAVI